MVNVSFNGRLAAAPETKSGKNGDFITARVGVDVGFGDNKTTEWIGLVAFDDRVMRGLGAAKQGSMLSIIGTDRIRTYVNKVGEPAASRDVTVLGLEFVNTGGGRRDNDATDTRTASSSRRSTANFDNFDDSAEVPF